MAEWCGEGEGIERGPIREASKHKDGDNEKANKKREKVERKESRGGSECWTRVAEF